MANAKRLTTLPDRPERWTWHPPTADLSAKDYSVALRRGAHRYAAAPTNVDTYSDGSIMLDFGYRGEGAEIKLGCMVGGGWGSHSRETVATWAGGKRWILRAANGYSRKRTLEFLDLPESDGRLLLIGAPAKPAKGVTAWRNRWTVSKGQVSGLTAVAGEGIEGASMLANLRTIADGLRSQVQRQSECLAVAITDAATAADALPAAKAKGERAMHLLESCNVQGPDGYNGPTYGSRNVSQVADALARRNGSQGDRRTRLHARAARMLAEYAQQDARPLAIGVRATKVDGTPMHAGPYSAPHRVGVPATAPDWAPHVNCGNGLHYIPLVHAQYDSGGLTVARTASECVQDACLYAHGDYALWIVRAEDERAEDVTADYLPYLKPEAVMIDGHKAKARTLTPLARIGQTGHGRAHNALQAWEHAQWQADTSAFRAKDAAHTLEVLRNRLTAAETTLKDWRKR